MSSSTSPIDGWLKSDESGGERGAVLALLAIFAFVLIVIGAIAVDLSALERRGQTLQNTADAAALAAVVTWQETGNTIATQARVDEVFTKNAVTGDDVTVQVNYLNPTDVEVVVTDTDPDVFLGAVVDFGGPITRDASARMLDCAVGCTTVIDLAAPFTSTAVSGSGDGYYPISVGNRLYAINHNSDEIGCVDRSTNSACWSYRDAIPYGGPRSGAVPHAVAVGDRIYWSAQDSSELNIHCWNTVTETSCGATQLSTRNRAWWLGDDYEQRGGGVVEVDGLVYAFVDNHRVHCFVPPSMNRCAQYGTSGKQTGIGAQGVPALNPNYGVSGSNIDRVVNETNGQIFHTLHIEETSASESVYPDTGTFLDCWDTVNVAPCAGFTPHKLHDEGSRGAGRLFLHRDLNGVPGAVCSTGIGDLECTYFNGNNNSALESALSPLESALPSSSAYKGNTGVHFYHEYSNRLLISVGRKAEEIHCWDFTLASYCGSTDTPLTQDYGFTAQGPCLYGVGHYSVFWTFTSDLSSGCPGGTTEVDVEKCGCGGDQSWGTASFNFDVGAGEDIAVLNVQVLDQDRNLVYPDDGSTWLQFVGSSPHTIDLSVIPLTHDKLIVRVYLEATDLTPWLTGDPPFVAIGFRELPALIE